MLHSRTLENVRKSNKETNHKKTYCAKSARIWNFFGTLFSRIRTECGEIVYLQFRFSDILKGVYKWNIGLKWVKKWVVKVFRFLMKYHYLLESG